MTREEAKDYIREWCSYDKQDEIIKSLERSNSDNNHCSTCEYNTSDDVDFETHCRKCYGQEWKPKQSNSDEDCISRAEALKKMQEYHDDCAKTSEYTRLGFETAMEVVKSLPSIQPKYKKAIEDIKAELRSKVFSEDWVDNVVYLDDCLEIIDKHTAESEE